MKISRRRKKSNLRLFSCLFQVDGPAQTLISLLMVRLTTGLGGKYERHDQNFDFFRALKCALPPARTQLQDSDLISAVQLLDVVGGHSLPKVKPKNVDLAQNLGKKK